MINELYYEFELGFNVWYLMVPLMMIMSFVIGTTKYRLGKATGRIYVMRGEFLVIISSVIMDVLLLIVFTKESFLGMVQIILNHMSGNEIAWTPIAVAGCCLAVTLLFFYLFYGCAKLGEKAIHALLVFLIRREIRSKEELEIQDIVLSDIQEILKGDKIIYFEPRRSPRT